MEKSKAEENKYWEVPHYRLKQLVALRGIKAVNMSKEKMINILLEDDIKDIEGVDKKMEEKDEFVEDMVVEQKEKPDPKQESKPIQEDSPVRFKKSRDHQTQDNTSKVNTFESKVNAFMEKQQTINEKLLEFLSGGSTKQPETTKARTEIVEPKVFQVDENTAIMSEVSSHSEKINADSIKKISTRGIVEAKKLNNSRTDRVEISDVYVASELNHAYGWRTTKIKDGVHYMVRG